MMNGTGHEFLASTAFASNQDAGLAELLETLDIIEDALEMLAMADEAADTPALGFLARECVRALVRGITDLLGIAAADHFGFESPRE